MVAHQLVRPSHSLRKPPANPKTQTNCLTEVLFDEALQQAKKLDAEFTSTGKLKGPLHGIPITLKDQFNVKGVDSTLGYVGRSFQPASEDAVLVQILKDMGAIVIAKTNLCQSIMVCMHLLLCYMSINDMDSFLTLLTNSMQWGETENPLWGLTTNPRNPSFTPGGSTGGEGPLLALHGSILGFGTDIGGSIRIPQSFAGLYGLKPSVSSRSNEAISYTLGIKSRSKTANLIPNTEQPLPLRRRPRLNPRPRTRPFLHRPHDPRPLLANVHHQTNRNQSALEPGSALHTPTLERTHLQIHAIQSLPRNRPNPNRRYRQSTPTHNPRPPRTLRRPDRSRPRTRVLGYDRPRRVHRDHGHLLHSRRRRGYPP